MIARIPLLTGLFVVQLVILALLMLGGDEERTAMELLAFETAEVVALTIEDGDGNTVSLTAQDGAWRLGELPADGGKVSEVIDSLVGGSANWPVATSESSQARFEVSEDAFQRRVQFDGESGTLATLYLGSSPGFRRIHAREADAQAIFSIDFGVHELPVDDSDWLDKQLFQVETVTSLTFPTGEILSGDDEAGWTLDGQPADEEAATRFIDRIAGLTVLGLFENGNEAELGEPVSVLVEDGEGTHRITFRFNEAVDEYVLESDRLSGAFTVASYIVEQILVPADDLLPAVEIESGEDAEVAAEAEESVAGQGTAG